MSSKLFSGRLGLEKARIPYTDRHGLLWLSRGNLLVESGTLHFIAAESSTLKSGDYAIPYQNVSMILLGPGSTVSHDALRILARHGTQLVAVGDGGVKMYSAPPMGQGRSDVARKHALKWADSESRTEIARQMFALRFGLIPRSQEISVLRGMEGARMKELYKTTADQYRVPWRGRRYDRNNPQAADIPNQAINHAATFIESAAEIAVAAVGALPPLGFIHEDSSNAFLLDIADLWRTRLTLPLAFSAARKVIEAPSLNIEREVRFSAADWFRREKVIPEMIDQIKELLLA